MKIRVILFAALSLSAYASQSLADDKKTDGHGHGHEASEKGSGHDHEHGHEHVKIVAGPNGGRVLTGVDPHLEFYVTKERTVKITALDKNGKPVKIGKQRVSIVAGDRKKPTKLKLEEKDGVLVSTGKLPEGNEFPISIGVKANTLSKRVYEKFNLNLKDCPSCDYKEYACTCGHHSHD